MSEQQEWIGKICKELERMTTSQLEVIFNDITRGKQEAKREGKKIRRRRNLDILTKDDIADLLKASNGILRDNLVLRLLIDTGVTLGELYGTKNKKTGEWEHGVQKKDVDFKKKKMWVYIPKRLNPVRRAVRIDDPSIIRLLKQYINEKNIVNSEDYIFRDTMSSYAMNQIPRLNAIRAKINKNVSAQSLRTYFIVGLLREGKSIEDVQNIVGHRDVGTTRLYLKYV